MAKESGKRAGRAGPAALREWRRARDGHLVSVPVRCKRDEWYLARARLAPGVALSRLSVLLRFTRRGVVCAERCLHLHRRHGAAPGEELLGWLETPEDATHLEVCVPTGPLTEQVAEIVFHNVTERDPKCHPLANTPRWATYQPPFTIQRILLPERLAAVAELLPGQPVQVLRAPTSREALARAARGSAVVLEPGWVHDLKLGWPEVEALAAGAWLIVDLETLARLLSRAGVLETELATYAAGNGTMSARVEYAEVPTRGFALQDVVPYSYLDERGRFGVRGIRASRAWKQFAADAGFATLLSGETPWEEKHGDVLAAMRPVRGGELLATDLPWLVAGAHGPLLAPRVAAHLLRMHLGAPLADHVQYWNRWSDGDVVVRDIADLTRYAPLQTVRWAAARPDVAHLGLTMPPHEGSAARHLVLRTGRIDDREFHDGVPPEPLMIFMKWLAREAREQTVWARRHLARQQVTWQFDTATGVRYACNYDAGHGPAVAPQVVRLRCGDVQEAGPDEIVLAEDEGVHGDGSLELQDRLARRLIRLLEVGTH